MKFTIAIPTRNRSSLLSSALRSALNQDFDDFEIVVSNNYSDDNTESVVGQFDDKKLRYIKTDRPMSMVEHFNFVLDHTRGEWIMYLCDDDAILPHTLSYISKVIKQYKHSKIFMMRHAIYTYSDIGGNNSNSLSFPRDMLTKEMEVVESINMLKKVFFNLGGPFPRIQNSFVHASLLEQIKHKYGKAFFPWAPDYTNGVLLLANTEMYIRLLRPTLYICGKNMASYGSGSRVNPQKLVEFFREFDEFKGYFHHSPYPELFSVDNTIYETFSLMRDQYLAEVSDLSIDPYGYRKKLLAEIKIYIESGYNEFVKYHKQISEDIKRYPQTSGTIIELKRMIKYFVKDVLNISVRNRVIDGDNANPNFTDIYKASLYLNKHYNFPLSSSRN